MKLPFTIDQFFGVMRAYNEAVWPAQVLLTAAALAAIGMVLWPRRWSGVAISSVLGLLWLWLGLAHHLAFFRAINPLALVFAGVSVAGGLVFLWQGVVRRQLAFCWPGGLRGALGLVLLVFALAVYPVWSTLAGHAYPSLPTFGLPCPTTIFSIGLLAMLQRPHPRAPLVVPVLWSLVGAQAAFLLDVPPDLGLLAAGVVGMGLFARADRAAPPALH